MSGTTFETNPVSLPLLLTQCEEGKLQLPDFQRSWVWEEERIMSLIASISRGFPVGALMTLKSKTGVGTMLAHRLIEGAPVAQPKVLPDQLLLDGQQRMTSLYQSCMRKQMVHTITAKKRVVKRWFYIDIRKALAADEDRESAILAMPEDRRLKQNFDKDIKLDLSSPELEYEHLMYPLNQAFNWDTWQEEFGDYWICKNQPEKRDLFKQFKNEVLKNFSDYQVPVIALGADTSHEAVCLVFEKVNTGGKALDAFELLTAMYAAQGFKLRDDWLGIKTEKSAELVPGLQHQLMTFGHAANQEYGVLAGVGATDFLQAIALLHTKEQRLTAQADSAKKEGDWPAVRATRQSLLDLPLAAYKKYRDNVVTGFERAAKFLRQQHIYRVYDLPYQSQLIPMAAIFAEIGDKAEHAVHMQKIARWYWCGVFGELYGSATESRSSRDVLEVPAWLNGGPEPSTVTEGALNPDRLLTMRTRLSAAYKGINALLMRKGALDFRSGQPFDQTIFFDEGVDIHHILPKAWCESQKIPAARYDSVVNKTPLGYRTNRIIGGVAPSKYLQKLEQGGGKDHEPPLDPSQLNVYLSSHCIPVESLRADNFDQFMIRRQQSLVELISEVTGQPAQMNSSPEEGEEFSAEFARDSDAQSLSQTMN